jgi:threonyl-tRNA synthetase
MLQYSLSDSRLRQTAAELLACAILRTFPKSQIIRTEATEGGFLCDFAFEEKLDTFALKALTEQMLILARENPEPRYMEMMRENAKELLRHKKQFYLADQAAAHLHNTIKLVSWNDQTNILRAPISPFADITHFRLLNGTQENTFVPGHGDVAMWRIHGVIFNSSKDLKAFSKSYDRDKKLDHRTLGRELELFIPAEYSSTGAFLWLPRGKTLIDELHSFWKQKIIDIKAHETLSPPAINTLILKKWNPYLDGYEIPSYEFETTLYTPTLSTTLYHAEIFAARTTSYKELPYRLAEWNQVSTFTPSHQTKGLLRSRFQLQDSIHSFCAEGEIVKELKSFLQFIIESSKILGFEVRWFLSSKGKKSAGSPENWKKGFEWLKEALSTFGETAEENPGIVDGEGPALYLSAKDHLNREWPVSSVGINLNVPHRLGLRYQGADNEVHLPWLIHAQLFQSVERIVGLMLEQNHGWLPLWLAPEQIRVIPVSEQNKEYASELLQTLLKKNFRASLDQRNEKLGAKLRAVDRAKVPIALIVGSQEELNQNVAVRRFGREESQTTVPLSILLEQLTEECDSKRCPEPFEE